MAIRAFACWLLILSGAPGLAATPDPAGRWALHAGGKTLLILELRRGADEAKWTGRMERPTRLQMTDRSFSAIEGPVVRRAVRGGESSAGGLELIAEGMRPGDTDIYVFRVSEEGYGELGFKGVAMAPLILVRAAAGERVDETWAAGRAYAQDWEFPSNAEMKALFEADQAARRDPAAIDRSRLGPEDARRREAARALLDAGRLRSGEDFYHAAYVFQHGDKPADFLLAHLLATVAVARGRSDATWIAAASLDRHLQAIGQKQVFGTQYSTSDGGATTQEPYDRTLVPDALRVATGVPTIAQQEERRRESEARTSAPAPR
jgi:hypothetical protein